METRELVLLKDWLYSSNEVFIVSLEAHHKLDTYSSCEVCVVSLESHYKLDI